MVVLEQTLAEWSSWFVGNRGSKFEIYSTSTVDLKPETMLTRIFAAADGKVPKKGYHLTGSAWEVPKNKPKNHLILLYGEGHPPLILAIPDDLGRIENCATKAQSTVKLTPPYMWRCKVCRTIGKTQVLEPCCEVKVRQLAPLSDFAKNWFSEYAVSASFKFIPPSEISNMPGISQDQTALNQAIKAGTELEQIFKQQQKVCPEVFEVYGGKTHHIRVSDLKKRKDFLSALSSAVKHKGKKIPPIKSAPSGNMIELGHVLDEFFDTLFSKIGTENWGKGERVHFNCEQLGLSVTGSPDLKFSGIPVEMKTTKILPTKGMNKDAIKRFRNKWKTNYLPQIAMYSHASSVDWMYLLLVSRKTGDFTILPVDGREKIEKLQNNWAKWPQQKRIRNLLLEYSKQ